VATGPCGEADEEMRDDNHHWSGSPRTLFSQANSLRFAAFTKRPNSRASIVNENGNITSIVGNGAVVTNNNWIHVVQNPEEQVGGSANELILHSFIAQEKAITAGKMPS